MARNIKINAKPPADYVPALDAKLSGKERDEMYFWHALPDLWWELDYETFLKERRVRMARVIQRAWEELSASSSANVPPAPPSVEQLIFGGETDAVEFKSTLGTNLHTGQSDDKMQISGTLLLG